jgi:predicted nucleotidyltransferase
MLSPARSLGSPRMRAMLAAIVDHYADDLRVRAVAVFGSLGRGAWDAYSDADLDVVTADGIAVDVAAEVAALCQALEAAGEHAVLIVPGPRVDSADVVLASLLEFSIRYHPLEATSPNITDSLVVLAGTLSAAEIVAAGEANRAPAPAPAEYLARCLRYTLEADSALRRGELWGALDLLHRARTLLFDLYAATHTGAPRLHHLQRDAPGSPLTTLLAGTVPTLDAAALRATHSMLLDVLEHRLTELTELTGDRVALTAEQLGLIRAVRNRGG